MGLFQTFLQIEAASGKSLKKTLEDINFACGTAYRHNWPSKMAQTAYALERTPIDVRRYMMRRVLPAELAKRGVSLPPDVIDSIIITLT